MIFSSLFIGIKLYIASAYADNACADADADSKINEKWLGVCFINLYSY